MKFFEEPLIKKYSIRDISMIFILMSGPTLGSSITVAACVIGFYAVFVCLVRPIKIMVKPLTYIAFIYITYIMYFILNGALTNGLVNTLLSMAPNLPILLFAFVAISFDWSQTNIKSSTLGLASMTGALISITIAGLLWVLSYYFQLIDNDLIKFLKINDRLNLLAGNPLPFSTILTALSFFGLVGYSSKSSFTRASSWLTIILTGLVIVFWSESRGAQLTFVLLLIYAVSSLRGELHLFELRKIIFLVSSLCILLPALVFSYLHFNSKLTSLSTPIERIYNGYAQLFSPLDEKKMIDKSIRIRQEIYSVGLKIYLEKPIFGFGHSEIYNEVQSRSELLKNYKFSHLHNAYLNHLIGGGIFGLLIFLTILFLPWVIIQKSDQLSRENRFFSSLIIIYSFSSGLTNLYFNHDILVSFHALLPLLLWLCIIGDARRY